MKRVFIVHGWGGNPNEAWLPWLKSELQKRGFEVHIPAMPNTNHPNIEEWVPFLAKQVDKPDKDTYFVGGSIGCQTIMRYLESIDTKVGGAVFVAGWLHLANLETDEERKIAKPWLETPIGLHKVKTIANKISAIFSDNDQWVPLDDSNVFKKELGAKIIVEKGKGHFDKEKRVPVALEEILKIAK